MRTEQAILVKIAECVKKTNKACHSTTLCGSQCRAVLSPLTRAMNELSSDSLKHVLRGPVDLHGLAWSNNPSSQPCLAIRLVSKQWNACVKQMLQDGNREVVTGLTTVTVPH